MTTLEAAPSGKNLFSRLRGSKAWAFFNSIKLTLFILISLAVVSIFGTVIEQGKPEDVYLLAYGERWTKLIYFLNLDDMYHSVWFTALLVLLTANIIVCTLDRFSPKWRNLLRSNPPFDPSIISKLKNREVFTVSADIDTVKGALKTVFNDRGYRVKTYEADKGIGSGCAQEGSAHGLYAWRGKIGRFGSDFTHVSLLIILLGSIIGSFFGFSTFRPIPLGGNVAVPNTDFELRLDKFWIEYYDNGQVKQYNSDLTVVRDGRDVTSKHIWVNEPFDFAGIRFFQASYGTSWNTVKEAQISAVKRVNGNNEFGPPVNIKWGETGKLPDTPWSARVTAYVADFVYDDKYGVTSKSAEALNPAVRVEVYEDGKLVSTPWLFFNYPGYFADIPDSDYYLVLVGYRSLPYSGISINKDPGTNIVWLGSIIMGFGFIFAFYVNFKRVWVDVKENGNLLEVAIGGMINKNQLSFTREFSELAADVRSRCGAARTEETG
jgi:cytochrome c biogenesis protein